ncbi:MAG: dTMP kinase [Chloracidobacterium sp.]|nr:dTMP kinase [Chloracidobacterium sp.]MDW8218434.1 dTMP kinase [Acidobacteriota bacterium]
MLQNSGFFISFEGIDGCGKTTQAAWLAEDLAHAGRRVTNTHEPGGTLFGQRLREVLLMTAAPRTPKAEALLFAADRAQHVAEVICPALERGDVVICDRFADSTRAYQGGGRRLPTDFIETVIQLATGGLEPHLTFLLDLPVREARARLTGRGGPTSGFDAEDGDFYERVRAKFLTLARAHPTRIYVLDATQPPDAVHAQVWEVVGKRLGLF